MSYRRLFKNTHVHESRIILQLFTVYVRIHDL